jgi:PAS domain S-box-containing protein
MHSARPGLSAGVEEGVQLPALAGLASSVESSEDAIIGRDLTGTIVSWNRGAAAVYGYTPQEAIGQSINMLVPPERADEEQAVLAKIRNGERLQHFETIRVRKGGTRIHVSLSISPVWEDGEIVGASHVARDISDRKHLEAANARLAAVVESSDDAIISKDLNGIVQTWNTGAEQVYGYSREEAAGRSIAFLLPVGRAHEEQEILARLRRGERVQHCETTRLRKDGSLIHVSLTVSPIRDVSGQVVGASHVARDITERKENLEVQMRQTQRLESLGVLAGGIAHDFNNLLTGIIGNASLVAEMLPSQEPARSYLDNLMLASQRAADLSAQLLAYSGRGQFVVGPVNLTTVVSEVNLLIGASIPKTVSVHMELDPELPMVEADRNQMQQLFMNLILNGAEAVGENRSGSVVVRTSMQHLDQGYIDAALAGSSVDSGVYACVEIRDDGCGMDDETKARIFEPFFTTKFSGRGLGLSAALGIVNAHRGVIRVYSTLGHGTTFKVWLPALAAVKPEEQRHTAPAKSAILVVDDEEMVRKVAKASLEKRGYTVLVASNGREGVDLFSNVPSIALVILDLTMPVMNGDEALRRMRQARPGVPVIVSSGYTEAETMKRFRGEPAVSFIQKPYTGTILRAKVEFVLQASTVA